MKYMEVILINEIISEIFLVKPDTYHQYVEDASR